MPALVSIVLPTHNGERYLAQSIESCLAQTYRDLELIVVDDCSSDATPQIARRFADADPRVRVLRNDPNRKLPASLNRGFAETKGAFLTWTSDDNWYRPEAIASMVEVLEARPSVALVYADVTDIDDAGAEIRKWRAAEADSLVERNCVGACFLYRRAVMERLGGYAEDLFLAEDYDYWLRVYAAFEIQPLNRDLYAYRRHPDSLTNRHLAKVRDIARRVIERHLPEFRRTKPMAALRAELSLSRQALDEGDVARSRRLFFGALGRHPFRIWQRLDGFGLPVTAILGRPVASVLEGARDRVRGEPGERAGNGS